MSYQLITAKEKEMQNQLMSRETIKAGNTMMIENILNMPVQPYEDGKAVYRVAEIQGQKTGQLRQTPLAVVQYAGQRYLIAPSRGRDWVYNLIASGVCTLRTKTQQERCHAVLTLDDEAIVVVQAYMAHLPDWALQQFPFPATDSAEEIRSKSEDFAIFRLS
jgi:deazaflavin-dependent oxidoreductase (nitroreductase family)